ncbi:unnamed protein product [Nesidiocoris tenuis]|uniref:Uncharacterized protein n=1 Tax=Nesidiocoris tenuis TaxID=355587 RepID=A0A6H5H9U7_9HEMI|nr:unnamed protein product [Nesidiocoris tenuis]
MKKSSKSGFLDTSTGQWCHHNRDDSRTEPIQARQRNFSVITQRETRIAKDVQVESTRYLATVEARKQHLVPRSEQITKGTTKTIKMMPMVLLGLVAVAAAIPAEFAREEQVNKEGNLIPIYKPGFGRVNHNLFGMYPFQRSMEYDIPERQVLPYRHYYSKEQSPLAYKRNYFARYLDLDEPEYFQDDEYYPYDNEMSFYKQGYINQPTYNYYKKYFTVPYSPEYFYNIPHSYKYAHQYNPYSYSQQYKQYYNYYPYIHQHQQYDSPLYYSQQHKNQFYHYYPLINKQRSVEHIKPTAYDYMMYKHVLPQEQARGLPLDTTVSTTPVQQTLAGKVQYVNKDLLADKFIEETPIGKKVVVQMQPIVSKTLQDQPIVGKPIVQQTVQPLTGKSLVYDQETGAYYTPLTYGQQQQLISKPVSYESFPSVGKVLPYQQQSIVEKSQIYNQQPIVSHDLEQSQQSIWGNWLQQGKPWLQQGKVLYPVKIYDNQPIEQLYIQKQQPALGKIFGYDQHQLMNGQEYNSQQSIAEEQIGQDVHYQPIYGKGLLYDQFVGKQNQIF